MKYTTILYLLIIVTICQSCYDDVRESEPIDIIIEAPEVLVDAAITGLISTSDGKQATTLQIGTRSLTIDQSPFYYRLNSLQQNHTTAIAYHDGWPVAIATDLIVHDDINVVDLDPMQEALATSTGTYEVVINNVTISGQLNSGDLKVFELAKSTTLHGYSAADQLMLLSPTTGFAIIARDSNGDLRTTLESDQLVADYTDAGLSLYHLDQASGAWRATETVDQYGYYMIAEDYAGKFVSGSIKIDQDPVAYQPVQIDQNIAFSTLNGRYRTVASQDANLIHLITPCASEIKAIDIPQTAGIETTVDVAIDAGSNSHFLLSTRVLSCTEEISDHPIIKMTDRDAVRDLYLFDGKEINHWIPTCAETFSLSAWDASTATLGTSIPWSIYNDATVDLLSSCGQWEDGYAFLEIEGQQSVYTDDLSQMIDGSGILINIDGDKLQLRIDDNRVAKYNESSVNIAIDDPTFGPGYFMDCLSSDIGCGLENTTVSHVISSDDMTRITFSGELWIQRTAPRSAGVLPVFGHILITKG